MFGPSAHPAFIQRLVPSRTRPILSRARRVLSLQNNCYYLHGAFGLYTKTYLTNYFNFLCDTKMPASWHIECLRRDGTKGLKLTGDFSDQETTVIDFAEYNGLDAFGVMRVQVILRSPEIFLPDVHATLYYKEFYTPGSVIGIMAHSLHVAKANHGIPYPRISPGLLVPPGFRPHLLIASGCGFQPFMHAACANASLAFINFENKKQIYSVSAMKPGECLRIDLFEQYPALSAHLQNKPFALQVVGENFLAKPFILFSNGTTVMGEHL